MQQIAAIQKKDSDKTSAAPVSQVQQEPVPDTENMVSESGVPLFLQRFSIFHSPPPIQRDIDEEEEEEEEEKETTIFPKLTVAEPDDEYEKEADLVADTVIHMPETLDKKIIDNEEEDHPEPATPIHAKRIYTEARGESIHAVNLIMEGTGGGSPLPESTRSRIEPVLGFDLSHVRIHDDARAGKAARSIHAKAFTHQNNIWLGHGQSPDDIRLMTHELTHVVQQGKSGSSRFYSDELQRMQSGTDETIYRSLATDLISSHTSWGNLDERTLGRELLQRARNGEYTFILQVFNELGPTDRDDVAYEWMLVAEDSDLSAAVQTGVGRRMLICFYDYLVGGWSAEEERREALRINEHYPRVNNPRIVPNTSFERFIQGMHCSFVVRVSDTERADDEIRGSDQQISFTSRVTRLETFRVEDPEGHLSLCFTRASSAGGAVAIFTLQGEHRLEATISVPGQGRVTVERRINVERPDFAGTSLAAVPADIAAEMPATTLAQDSRLMELTRVRERVWAANSGLLSRRIYDAWADLSITMIRIGPAMTGGQLAEADRSQAAAQARALHDALDAETPYATPRCGHGVCENRNEFTGERSVPGMYSTAGYGQRMAEALERGDYSRARRLYISLIDGLDAWILDRIQTQHGEENEHYRRLTAATQMQTAMRGIARYNPRRVPAYFHPKQHYLRTGGISAIPLALYYWKQDDEWHLKDLTAPTRTFEDTHPAREGERLPPTGLFARLDYRDHFPEGYVYYQLPGEQRYRVETRGRLTLSDYLSYIALGAAAVGLILVTAGAGAPAVAAFGTGMLIGSGIVGAAGAAVHMGERAGHGALDPTTAVLDVLQIIAGLASAGTIVAGTAVRAAGAAARAGTPLTGTAARFALAADSVYVPLLTVAAGADLATMAVLTGSAASQLREIDRRGGTEDEKRQAKILLFSQLLVMGAITIMSVRGSIPEIRAGRSLELDLIDGVYHARVRGYGEVNAMIDDILLHGPGAPRRLTSSELSSVEAAISSGQLTEAQRVLLLGEVVADARAYRMAQRAGQGESSVLSWDVVRGSCGGGRDVSAVSLGERLANSPVTAHIDRLQALNVLDLPEGFNHAFSVVRFSDGSRYIIDPTFAQFMRPRGSTSAMGDATAEVMRHSPADAEFVYRLARDGFVELNETTARQYARALGASPEHAARVGPRLFSGERTEHTDFVGNRSRTVQDFPDVSTSPDVLSRNELIRELDDLLPALRSSGDPEGLLPYLERLRRSLN